MRNARQQPPTVWSSSARASTGRLRTGRLRTAATAVLGGTLLALGGLAGPAAAEPGVITDDSPMRTLVLLDVSGSMARDGGHGGTLMDGARRALTELVHSMPRGAEFGLRVYGANYGGKDRAKSCADTSLPVPIGPLQAEQVVSEIDALEPTGDTPIGRSLTMASVDFGKTQRRDTIVLISDGEDNCSTSPPCDVVRDLQKDGLRVRVQTVGVALAGAPEARQQLQCISQVTGGNYFDAQDSDALSAALARISQQSKGRLGGGKNVQPSSNERRPPKITPGAYRVTIRPGQSLYYRFNAPVGAHPRVLGTIQGRKGAQVPAEAKGCRAWRVELRNRAGEGRIYPPYGNTGKFDGRDFGSTGASTSGKLEERPTGIDYAGRWTVRLALGVDGQNELMECAEHLAGQEFSVRFSLDYDGLTDLQPGQGGDKNDEVTETATPTPTPTQQPSATATTPAAPEASDAGRQYDLAEPEGSNWGTPVMAVLIAVGLGGAGFLLYRIRQRRTRGW